MKAMLLRPQHASINMSASAQPQTRPGVRPGPPPPPGMLGPSRHQPDLHPTGTLLPGMGLRAACLGGEGLVMPQTGHRLCHSTPPPPTRLSTAEVLVRMPWSEQCCPRSGGGAGGTGSWAISTTPLPSKSPPQMISVHPWVQVPASSGEGRHGREDQWLSSWGSSPELCPRTPVSLKPQPGCSGLTC